MCIGYRRFCTIYIAHPRATRKPQAFCRLSKIQTHTLHIVSMSMISTVPPQTCITLVLTAIPSEPRNYAKPTLCSIDLSAYRRTGTHTPITPNSVPPPTPSPHPSSHLMSAPDLRLTSHSHPPSPSVPCLTPCQSPSAPPIILASAPWRPKQEFSESFSSTDLPLFRTWRSVTTSY
jgi:hypothetical protein